MSQTNDNEATDFVQEAEQPAPASVAAEPAPKVSKQAPQEVVDKFWESFTTKYPGKVTSILPADIYAKNKAQDSPKGLVRGHSAGKSYEQAVVECKNAVIKIAEEYRRVNAKYRDPHFDIEFDLKRGRRDCLDSLEPGNPDEQYCPRSVKRVADIFEKPTFYEDDATASDIRQGYVGDCWLLAALCAISNKKHLVDNICVARDEPVGVYGFVFYRDGEWIQTIIDDKLYLIASDWWESTDVEKRMIRAIHGEDAEKHYRKLNQTGSKALYFAQCRSENETWLPLLEKAFAKAHGDYSAIDGGFSGEAIEDLTGGVTMELFTTDILDKDKFWTDEITKVNDKFLFGCSTGSFDKWLDSDAASLPGARGGIMRLHAYSIMDAVEKKGKRLVKVRNPWGTDEWRGAWSDGSEQWTGEWLGLLNHTFGDDGVFWISYEDLLEKYTNFNRTRLFDKNWQVVQQWTTVNVPWTADYNDTKFSLVITKRGPVVVALSQLDDRYFKGLQGQYSFELHFRLSKDGSDDYIVRSHGNYSTRRSVSVDIDLEPGTYSVLMKITAQRDDRRATPDVVIKGNVKYRQSKIVQVGLAYDLAHAKGVIRETEAEKQEERELEGKKKADEKKEKRAEFRKAKVKEFERTKREKAREKRRAKRQETSQQKKAERGKIAEAAKGNIANEGGDGAMAGGNGVAAGDVKKVDEQAAAATDDAAAESPIPPMEPIKKENESSSAPVKPQKSDSIEATISSDQTSEVDPKADIEADTKSKVGSSHAPNSNGTTKNLTDPNLPDLTDSAIKSVPSVAINGIPSPPSNPATPNTVAPSATNNINIDDTSYDSDTSFVSSIDSILDLDLDSSSPSLSPSPSNPNDPTDQNTNDNDDDPDTPDPWNAVCTLGLRVYSQDPSASITVVRPKEVGERESGLDLDDGSKGVSGEGKGEGGSEGVEVEVTMGV